MIVRNRVTKKVYICSQRDAAKIVQRSVSSLRRWQHDLCLKAKYVGAYEIIFDDPRVIKQKKGFAIKKRPKC